MSELETYNWVCKVIDSCETIEQSSTSRKLIVNYNKMFKYRVGLFYIWSKKYFELKNA